MADNNQLGLSDKYSLRGRVFDTIRDRIISGEYPNDMELRELTLAKEFNVSRTPIREALRQLELEGLVNIIPNKGAYVIGITKRDIIDIYYMRSLLEGLCAKMAVHNITEEQLQDLEENIDLSEFALSKKRMDHVVDLDNEFHDLLYRASNSRMLHRTLSDFHQYLEPLRKKSLSDSERVSNTIDEHRKIVEAIKNKDEKKAYDLANGHILKSIDNLENKHLLSENS